MNAQIQAIRAEIERRMADYKYHFLTDSDKYAVCGELLNFIDSLPEIEGNPQQFPLIPKTKWHSKEEPPEGDMEVLACYGGFTYANYVVVKYDNGYWWQHLPPMPPVLPDGGWFGIDDTSLYCWTYIEE